MASERVKPACLFLSAAALVASGCGTPPREAGAETVRGRGAATADPAAATGAMSPTEAPAPGAGPGADSAAEAPATPVVDGPPRPGLAPPPGFPPEALAPLEGDALAAATADLAEVRETLPAPIVAAARAAGVGAIDDAEPPLQAQRLFGRAQQALLRSDHAEAVQMLEAAARLAPGEPRILKELARGWLALGNRPRGVEHLREAVRLGEGDPDARLLLGQLLVDAGEPEAGLAELLAVLDAPALRGADPALRPLAAYQAGRTLVGLGRLDAALELFEAYRGFSREGLRPTRPGAALVELDGGAAGHLVREGDLLVRLGRPEEAAAAWAAAEAALPAGDDGEPGAARDPQLVARQVYADLRLGRDGAARERLVAFTNRSNAAPVALGLVSWAVESGLPGGPMVAQLRDLGEAGGGGDPAALALTLAVSLPRDEAIDLLRERQATAGFEPRVYDALLALLLAPDAEPTEADRARAVELVLETLREHPDRGYLATAAWFRRAGGAASAAEDFHATDAAGREDDAAALTLGTIVEREAAGVGMDAPQQEAEPAPDAAPAPAPAPDSDPAPAAGVAPPLEESLARLTRAVELQPSLALARVERARLLGAAGRHDEALAELDALADTVEDPRVPRLRVGLLLAAGRQADAAAALERLTRDNPLDATLVLQRAQLLAGTGDAVAAERALLDALSANPKSEPVYAALLQLYDDDRLGPSLPDYPQNFERLRRRIFQEIPESRVARLTAAEYLMLSGELDQARRVLGDLLESAEGDRAAQLLLLELLEKQNDTAAAGALVEEMLAARPRDAATLVAARDFYKGPGGPQAAPRNPDNFVAVLKRLRDLQEPGFARTWSTASIRLIEGDFADAAEAALGALPEATGQEVNAALALLVQATRQLDPAEAEPLLLQAAGLAPAFSDQLAFAVADAYDDAGRSEEAEAALVAALEASPNNAQLNNAVGYRWAYRGVRLEEAERLIGRAVAAETDSAAYLDSMGWVLYQQNRFDEALGWLNQSRARPDGANPVILLHLGDTLHRLGRTAEAEPVWAEALQSAAGIDPSLDPELDGIGDRLQARLDAAEADAPVPVARTGTEPGEPGGDVPVAMAEAEASAPEPSQRLPEVEIEMPEVVVPTVEIDVPDVQVELPEVQVEMPEIRVEPAPEPEPEPAG